MLLLLRPQRQQQLVVLLLLSVALCTTTGDAAAQAQEGDKKTAKSSAGPKTSSKDRPNVVLIMADDLGYGDLGCFGNTSTRTPRLDQLASQGVKLTHSVAAATMCTPSRAAFMTGRYSVRSGVKSPHFFRVFAFVASLAALPASELTIGEVAKKAGYRTAFLGKWHLGWNVDRSDPDHQHPLNQGFDYFYGVPLTNVQDFDDLHRPLLLSVFPNAHVKLVLTFLVALVSSVCMVGLGYLRPTLAFLIIVLVGLVCGYFLFIIYHVKLIDSVIYRNYDVAEQPIHLPSVTRKMVAESEEFLAARHEDQAPFLLMVSWVHMHTALATGPQFRGKSRFGPYGDALQEMDWGTGQVLDALERYGLHHNTLVYFTSDQGGDEKNRDWMGRVTGGFNGPFKGGKGDGSAEGAYRVPTMIRWPARLPANVSINEPVSLMDVLPTVAELLHVPLDSDGDGAKGVREGPGEEVEVVRDGRSLVPLLTGQDKVSPHEFLFHYCQHIVHTVTYRPRSGDKIWKLTFREPDPNIKLFFNKCNSALVLDPPVLYEMRSDPTATVALRAADHPKVVTTIMKGLSQHRMSVREVPNQFAWWRMMWQPWKQPCCNFPTCECQDDKFKGLYND